MIKSNLFERVAEAVKPHPIFDNILNSFSGKETETKQCDDCGCYTPIYVTVKGKNFCSETCKELFFLGMEDSKGADKLNDEQDTAVEDTFEDYLNEAEEFNL